MRQGHIRRRGEKSWELKFSLGTDSLTGKRRTAYHSFKGTRRDAERELTRLMAAAERGDHIDPSRASLAEFLDRWEAWAATQVSAKTLERYKELAALHVRPHLGAMRVQKLKTVNFAELYARLQRAKPEGAGLAPRTVGHVHRLMHRVLGHAVKWGVIAGNPVTAAEPPRVEHTEVEILAPDQIKTVLQALRGRPLYPIAVLALATGARRGELAALRWADVDLDGGKITIARSLEETGAGLAFKDPKTRAGRRVVSIPPSVVAEMRTHRKVQLEQRMALGLGRAPDDALVFARPDGQAWAPDTLSGEWARTVRLLKLPRVTLHGLRHTHVSQLIASGLDVVTVSRRIGHGSPTITLGVYAHLFGAGDDRAAQVVEAAFAKVLGTE
jgi:integrase